MFLSSWRWLGPVVVALVASACGRIDFDESRDGGPDPLDARTPSHDAGAGDGGDVDAGRDAGMISTDAGDLDAGAALDGFVAVADGGTVVRGECAAALVDPMAATDLDLWNCGVDLQLSACFVNDASTCGMCACMSYVRSAAICDEGTGTCADPINGTGCSDADYYTTTPFFCSGDRIVQSACMLRVLIAGGYC